MVKKLYEGVVEGTVYYLSPNRRSKYKGVEGKYDFTLSIDKKTAADLKKAGAKVLREKQVGKDEDGNPIELDYSIKPKSNYPIKCFDAATNSLDKALKSGLNIGNGSKVAVDLFVYENELNNGIGVVGVQILELVEYESSGGNAGANFTKRGEGIADKYEADQDASDEEFDDEIPF